MLVGTPCPAEIVVSSFLSALVVAASEALFAGVATSKLGVAAVFDVAGAVEVADAAVLVLEAALVDAAAVDDAGAVTTGFAS